MGSCCEYMVHVGYKCDKIACNLVGERRRRSARPRLEPASSAGTAGTLTCAGIKAEPLQHLFLLGGSAPQM